MVPQGSYWAQVPLIHIEKQLNKIHFIGFLFSPVLLFLFTPYVSWKYSQIDYLYSDPFLRLLTGEHKLRQHYY